MRACYFAVILSLAAFSLLPACKSTPEVETPTSLDAQDTIDNQPGQGNTNPGQGNTNPVSPNQPVNPTDPNTGSEKTASSPKRIIFFIGDGMGTGAISAATYAKGEPLAIMELPHYSFMANHEYEYITTDSGASATAFATGKKTHWEGISVKPGTTSENEGKSENHLRTLFEAAKAKGMRTGLVATSRINHATPAAFAAHRVNRSQYEDIASDIVDSRVDVLLGAGYKYFDQRSDKKNLLDVLKADGYSIAKTAEEVRNASQTTTKLVGLMHEKDMPPVLSNTRAMSLEEMTRLAIETLDRNNPEGWVLMVEGSQIDWCEHDLEGRCTVAETLDFDKAVKVGSDYVGSRNDALMVVTADHETGGVSVLDPGIWKYYSRPLGGMDKIGDRAKADPNLNLSSAEPIPTILTVGDASLAPSPNKATKNGKLGLSELDDPRYTVSFGFVSVESRHIEDAAEHSSFSGAHTTTFVPLFAKGVGADRVSKITDNAELGQVLLDFVDNANYKPEVVDKEVKPKNVILLVGDGMGINSVTAAYYGKGAQVMVNAPFKGIVSTHGTNAIVNDSAATATALATGQRTRKGALGVVWDDQNREQRIETILEKAEKYGARTGLVTTTPLTHATPAAFYAHTNSRKNIGDIANSFINVADIEGSDGIDVAIASGKRDFDAARLKRLTDKGYTILDELPDAGQGKDKSVIFMAEGSMDIAATRVEKNLPSLKDMTERALEILSQDADKGFFLMVEGGQIDWMLHGEINDDRLLTEIAEFDAAVGAAVAYANKHKDTLVIATADHDHTMSVLDNHYAYKKRGNCLATKECGGSFDLPVLPGVKSGIKHGEGLSDPDFQKDGKAPGISLQYDWLISANQESVAGPHSANFVPLYAWGPGAWRFESYRDQKDVGKLMIELTGWGKKSD